MAGQQQAQEFGESIRGRTDVQISRNEQALGGGLEGAERTSRETYNWQVASVPPDRAINSVKEPADARAKDMVINDGYARGAIQSHMDSIVGAQFRLNAKIAWKMIPGGTKEWADEAQRIIEDRFHLIAESEACYLDAAGMNTFTGKIRLAVAGFVMTGEVLETSEWDRSAGRPIKTCFQSVDPSRLRNPDWNSDTRDLRRGVKVDSRGKPLGYYIQRNHPNSFWSGDYNMLDFAYIPRMKPWGRPQVIHIIEQLFPDQHRGVADMVAALKRMRMTKHLQDVVLQNAVINATYCAAIESEMPTAEMIVAMGGDASNPESLNDAIGAYLAGLQKYLAGAENIALDGAMIPHLYPGTKLNMKTLGTPGGVGTDFEASLLRHTAAALGMDYAEFSRDYSRMSYATAKLSTENTRRSMRARKKMVADRLATAIYGNVLEEFIAQGEVPLPPGFTRDDFYRPLMREAFSRCAWIGTGTGQIDELKETQAAILRIKAGLSTYEIEIGRLGEDWREIFEQKALEAGVMAERSLVFDMGTNKGNTGQGGDQAQQDDAEDAQEAQDEAEMDDNGDNVTVRLPAELARHFGDLVLGGNGGTQ
jgi:lambda family phage portal protein